MNESLQPKTAGSAQTPDVNPPTSDCEPRLTAKELSWLAFNERVLQEAADETVPAIQRLRFLGIFSNNLDEFYRVRVADVSRLAAFSSKSTKKQQYGQLLRAIQHRTQTLEKRFEDTYQQVLAALRCHGIYLINEGQLNQSQSEYVREFFHRQVLPELDPVLLDPARSLPDLMDGALYLAVRIESAEGQRYGLVKVPTDRLSRFVEIPQGSGTGERAFSSGGRALSAEQRAFSSGGRALSDGERALSAKQRAFSALGSEKRVFIVLENVIRHCMESVFRGVISMEGLQAGAFKLTMDAELELGEGVDQDLVNRVAHSLKKRQDNARLERFVYDSNMPHDLFRFLTGELKLGQYDSIMPAGRYLNAKDFMAFPNLGPASLEYEELPALPVPELQDTSGNILDAIRQRDLLLYYPYHSFELTIELLKTAAIDPAVRSIHISLYRVARDSRVVNALLSASENGKQVTAVVELQARFDEAANIDWARQLREGGVKVIVGIPGLKVHSKLILIRREEKNRICYYSHVGTGNFNEKTATSYTDFSLFTYDQIIGRDTEKVFDFIAGKHRHPEFEKLWVSPHTMRARVQGMIRREIAHAKAGLPAAITLKCNNLVDRKIIKILYKASGAGVRIRIICRSMCSLLPGVPGLSDNIQVISIVDRFLEHPRVFVFHNQGNPDCYISSADLMARNLNHRVEATAPVTEPALKQRILDIIDIQWCDNQKARRVDGSQSNEFHQPKIGGKLRSQTAIHRYLATGKLPREVALARKAWFAALAPGFAEPEKARGGA